MFHFDSTDSLCPSYLAKSEVNYNVGGSHSNTKDDFAKSFTKSNVKPTSA